MKLVQRTFGYLVSAFFQNVQFFRDYQSGIVDDSAWCQYDLITKEEHARLKSVRRYLKHIRKVNAVAQEDQMRVHFRTDPGDQIFMVCRKGAERVMGQRVEKGRPFLAWLGIGFIKYLDEQPQRRNTMRLPGFNSNKTQIGVLASWGIPLAGLVAYHFDIPVAGIVAGMTCVASIVVAHILGHAITDASANFGVNTHKRTGSTA